jgi:hypothetical protein
MLIHFKQAEASNFPEERKETQKLRTQASKLKHKHFLVLSPTAQNGFNKNFLCY